ncbi:Transmembrane emp24 domain trafficking protein 2 [Strongyloides ratti]|uniref:Transmembrane emp24 domain trafficking protein 2 n=1 Tax=Strongyloides ratti TaxID=34506 RepID=A0A090LB54_STRRB|nr:Transmembrane emp24 domain trafficking protein 2 [Strongyloides ratti]CEF65353.1 Transmembrane emp24 domain trafficking protein 2 [Strongyloides ratti]
MLKLYLFITTLFFLIFSHSNGYYLYLDIHEEQCYFEKLKENSHIGVIFEVADGGFLDIDYKIVDPNNVTIINGEQESSISRIISSKTSGLYKICFSNIISSKAPKILYFSIYIDEPNKISDYNINNEFKIDPEIKKTEEMVYELLNSFHSVVREQKYLTIRKKVHDYITKNTNNYIVSWAIFEVILLLSITFGQICYIKKFFEVKRVV